MDKLKTLDTYFHNRLAIFKKKNADKGDKYFLYTSKDELTRPISSLELSITKKVIVNITNLKFKNSDKYKREGTYLLDVITAFNTITQLANFYKCSTIKVSTSDVLFIKIALNFNFEIVVGSDNYILIKALNKNEKFNYSITANCTKNLPF